MQLYYQEGITLMDRAESDITKWVEYFCAGMVESFENVKKHAREAAKSGLGGRPRKMDVHTLKMAMAQRKNRGRNC